MLNLGCGNIFHKDWVNVDFVDHDGKVMAYDLRLGIPFADSSFDVIYHSHLLEHMPKAWGEFFIRECYRVLRPGGLLRVAVSDLEDIVRTYLETLDAVRNGEEGASERHQWMLTELIDPLTRNQGGGEVLNWLKQKPVPQEDFIVERLGKEAELGIKYNSGLPVEKIKTALPAIDTGFLLSGEKHAWRYDACYLKYLLQQASFTEIFQCEHNESSLPCITQYGLDTTSEGLLRKPNSFFMEAKKTLHVEQDMPRVTMFSTTDSGGAAIAALRLHNALQSQGLHSHMYVAQQQFFQNRVHVVPSKPTSTTGGITIDGHKAEKAIRRELSGYRQNIHNIMTRYPQRPQGSEYFSVPGQCVPFEHIPFLEETDILHFHWISGLCDPSLSLDYLRGKKIVWTLHDMNAFTGGCHYSNGCRKFEKMCGACPELGSTKERDLAFDTWCARKAAYRELDIHVVAPSSWLAEEARKSALLGKFPIHTIAYAQPLDIFQPLNRASVRTQLGLKENDLALLFASESLSNTRKGGIYLVKLLHSLAQTVLKDRINVFMLGHHAAPEFFKAGIKVQCLGHIDEAQQMAALYNAADAVLVPSLEDNQPNVICESLACGTPVVAFASGGIAEMIRHEETGYLAESKNVEGLLQGVFWVDTKNQVVRRLCRARALEQWSEEKGALMYMELYRKIT